MKTEKHPPDAESKTPCKVKTDKTERSGGKNPKNMILQNMYQNKKNKKGGKTQILQFTFVQKGMRDQSKTRNDSKAGETDWKSTE